MNGKIKAFIAIAISFVVKCAIVLGCVYSKNTPPLEVVICIVTCIVNMCLLFSTKASLLYTEVICEFVALCLAPTRIYKYTQEFIQYVSLNKDIETEIWLELTLDLCAFVYIGFAIYIVVIPLSYWIDYMDNQKQNRNKSLYPKIPLPATSRRISPFDITYIQTHSRHLKSNINRHPTTNMSLDDCSVYEDCASLYD